LSRGIIGCIAPRLVGGEPASGRSEPTPAPPVSSVTARASHEAGARLSPEFRAEVQARIAELQRMSEPAQPAKSLLPQALLSPVNSERMKEEGAVLWVAAIWIAGSILVFTRNVFAWLVFQMCSLQRRKLALPELLASIDALARCLAISRHVRVI